jgi:hypothetical protein
MSKKRERNDRDLVQAFLKKWWVESDFKAPNLPLSLRLKGSLRRYDLNLTLGYAGFYYIAPLPVLDHIYLLRQRYQICLLLDGRERTY